ncbi:MAG: BCCT family transporter, partial [Actinobacteria bacterium]|nr:BCCT family transporter [Actinomycetota bacterium]
IFFVTSSDSASLVIDMLTAGGDLDPPRRQRVFWATTEGAVAAVLLVAGGLGAMQTFQLTTGLPLCLVLIAMCYSLSKGLRGDRAGLSMDQVAQRQPLARASADEGGAGEGRPDEREEAPSR